MNTPKLTKEDFSNYSDTHHFSFHGRSLQVKFMPDTEPDLSWIGTFSNEPTEGAIEHQPWNNRTFTYFNPANPEYAQHEYEHMIRINSGQTYFIGVQVIITDIHDNESSHSLWGCEMPVNDGSIVDEVVNDLIHQCWSELPALIKITDDDAVERILSNCLNAIEEVVTDNPFDEKQVEALWEMVDPLLREAITHIIGKSFKGELN